MNRLPPGVVRALLLAALAAAPAAAQETTNTALECSPNPSFVGQTVTCTATVTSESGATTPTGSVAFDVDGNPAGTVTLNGAGQASFTTSALATGERAISAFYTSDSLAFAASSNGFSQIVLQHTTSLALGCAPNPSFLGQPVTCTATVTSDSGATPTGTVTFQIDGGSDVVVPLDAGGQAAFTTSTMTVGDHTVSAAYTPDTTDFTESGDSVSQSVVQDETMTTLLCAPNPSLLGQSVTCTATVEAESGATPTGTVTFEIDGGGAVVVPLDGAGQASFTTSTMTLGDHTVTADYTPDVAAFTASADSFAQSVVLDTTTTALACAPNPAAFGESVTCTATVSGDGGGTPTGSVSFQFDGGAPIVVPLAAGQASVTTSSLASGDHTVTADYSSDTTAFGDSSATPVLLQIADPSVLEVPALGAGGLAALGLLLALGGVLRLRRIDSSRPAG